ncbi:hypothetical protein U3450_003351 [Bacillus cytotoxicus]|uniref:hypothetical protein n=1 Tax=Bacillus cereus group sp. BfR-BA-01492 TaxID=2920361 RepID=UPI001F56EC2C|nr:hypothetical protein [Bacillus cereus group sp. BfR-BA-01492]EMA6344328.1 hypothetical protein [Bacillus cytotoxicus]
MKVKHGLSQYRLNYAKGHATNIAEMVAKVELLFHLSQEGYIDEEKAENGIQNLTNEIKQTTEYFLGYIEQREDKRKEN